MGKLNPKQVENLTEPGTYEDGDGLRLVVKPVSRAPNSAKSSMSEFWTITVVSTADCHLAAVIPLELLVCRLTPLLLSI